MRFRVPFLLAVVVALASCGDGDGVLGPPPDGIRITDTPRANREAEEAALWLSGRLIAPQGLYETVRDDLAAIRGEHLGAIPDLAITFFPPWSVTEIIVLPDDATWDRIHNGEPNAIDELNAIYHATAMDSLRITSHYVVAVIEFEGRLHPGLLAAIYDDADGVVYAQPNGYVGDRSNVYPWEHGGRMTYLFRRGAGDCPAGCTENEFWYFRRGSAGTEFVGHFLMGADPLPEWWDEAKTAYHSYMGYEAR